ncbi:MAG: cytochrome b561 [Motiliproteus sp.]|jgi:cytochrome b561
MAITNTRNSFGWLTQLLHWLVALHILGLIALGWYMVDLSYYDPNYHDSLYYHKAFGMLALTLAACKVLWFVFNIQPAPAAPLPPWQEWASRAAHLLLLGLMLIIPVGGYFISTSAGDGIDMLGLLEIPALIDVSDDWRDLAISSHEFLAYSLLALTGLHATAALKHQFIDRDGTLKRMLW